MLRQGDTGDWIGTFVGHKGAVWGVALNKDASVAATGAADFTAKLWNAVAGEELHTFTHNHIVRCVDFDAEGVRLLTGSNDKTIRIFDVNKEDAAPTMLKGHSSAIKKVLFLQDDKRIVSASDDKTVRFWDYVSGEQVGQLDLSSAPSDLELSPDGTMLLVTHGHAVSTWSTETFEKMKEFQIPSQVNSASLLADKSVFVCGGEDFKMYKFEYETGTELESFKGHFGPVHCVRFSPDGELYASGSEDGTLRLWQTTVGKTYGLWKYVQPTESGPAGEGMSNNNNNANNSSSSDIPSTPPDATPSAASSAPTANSTVTAEA